MWSLGVLQVGAFSLLTLTLVAQVSDLSRTRRIVGAEGVFLLLGIAWLFYFLIQSVKLPLEVIEFLNPAAAGIYRYALDASARDSFTLSLDAGLTLRTLLRTASYFAVLLLIVLLINTRARVVKFTFLIVCIVLAESVWAFIDYHNADLSRASGTFPNPNHLGALLEIGIPLTLGLIMTQLRSPVHTPNWKARIDHFIHSIFTSKTLLLFGLMIMLAALFFTKSRGAVFSLTAALMLCLVLVVILRGWHTRELRVWPFFVMMTIAASLWLGTGNFIDRLESSGLQTDRHLLRSSTYAMIKDYPLFGIGSGNWPHLYPMYKEPEMFTFKYTPHSHNDILELLAEQGSIGFALIGGAIMWALGKMIIALKRRRDPLMRGILFGCITSIISLLLHAWWEFHFHIPAIAAYFFAILGLGLVATRLRDRA